MKCVFKLNKVEVATRCVQFTHYCVKITLNL